MKQTKDVQVVPYNPEWPKLFQIEAALIKEILGHHCLDIHHIGSTSIPGLAAKENIDILCIVDNLQSALTLKTIGYTFKGEINIPLRYYFSKNTPSPKVNLHVTGTTHGFIYLNLCFRDFLRTNDCLRQAYDDLKYQLLQDPKSFERVRGGFPKYTLGKNSFIKNVLNQAGYDGVTFNFCTHYSEWDAAKKFRQTYIFDTLKIEDPYTWTFDHPDHTHLVMYCGTQIIGYAHVQLWPARAALRILAIEEAMRNQGSGTQFLSFIEHWLIAKGVKSFHIESSPEALPFYRKSGYADMPFNDPDNYESDPHDISVGKILA